METRIRVDDTRDLAHLQRIRRVLKGLFTLTPASQSNLVRVSRQVHKVDTLARDAPTHLLHLTPAKDAEAALIASRGTVRVDRRKLAEPSRRVSVGHNVLPAQESGAGQSGLATQNSLPCISQDARGAPVLHQDLLGRLLGALRDFRPGLVLPGRRPARALVLD